MTTSEELEDDDEDEYVVGDDAVLTVGVLAVTGARGCGDEASKIEAAAVLGRGVDADVDEDDDDFDVGDGANVELTDWLDLLMFGFV